MKRSEARKIVEKALAPKRGDTRRMKRPEREKARKRSKKELEKARRGDTAVLMPGWLWKKEALPPGTKKLEAYMAVRKADIVAGDKPKEQPQKKVKRRKKGLLKRLFGRGKERSPIPAPGEASRRLRAKRAVTGAG